MIDRHHTPGRLNFIVIKGDDDDWPHVADDKWLVRRRKLFKLNRRSLLVTPIWSPEAQAQRLVQETIGSNREAPICFRPAPDTPFEKEWFVVQKISEDSPLTKLLLEKHWQAIERQKPMSRFERVAVDAVTYAVAQRQSMQVQRLSR